MDELLQIYTLTFSFFYGIFFGLSSMWHFHISYNYKVVMRYLSSILFVIDIVLLYIFLMYRMNEGIFHLYFLSMVLVGFIVAFPLQNYVKLKLVKFNMLNSKGKK